MSDFGLATKVVPQIDAGVDAARVVESSEVKPRIEAEAELMRERAQILRGSGGWQRRKKQVQTSQQKEIRRLQQKANRLFVKKAKPIHPLIAAIRADELIAAGWGSHERWNIPLDWKTRRPGLKKVTKGPSNRQNGTPTSRKLA